MDNLLTESLKALRQDRPVVLKNETCVYCRVKLHKENSTKEHVVARKFVPRHSLDKQWNLIVRACASCNNRKSDLEDEIAAVTMAPDVLGRLAHEDESLSLDAARKSQRSRSRTTGRPVGDSYQPITIQGEIAPGVTFRFKGIGLPHVPDERIFALALLQVRGFFYWITYDHESNHGYAWIGKAYPVMYAPRSDWGNIVHVAFMNAVAEWEPRVLLETASGFFRIAVRKDPCGSAWSWVVEWNRNYRVIGFLGEEQAVSRTVSGFPRLELSAIDTPTGRVRARSEERLRPEDDVMFEYGG